jgi:hypothetical protein
MRNLGANLIHSNASRKSSREQASARAAALVLVVFLAGLVAGAYLYRRASPKNLNATNQGVVLSDSTKAILKQLDSPVEIRFYALLDPATVPESLRAFATRLEQLLAQYQQEGGGKINLTRHNSQSGTGAQAAAADGIKPFNREKGNVCYLGIAIAQDQQKETLPQLAPQWESAVESDITRAIARVIAAKLPAKTTAVAAQADATAIEEVKRIAPNYSSVSLEEGTRILREAALKDFAAAADQADIQVKEAQQRVRQAENGGSQTEQQAALKNLQQVQLDQAEKLKAIAARHQAQLAALQQLKK